MTTQPRPRQRTDAVRMSDLVVGRTGTGADVEIDDPRVHRDHARLLTVGPGRWRVVAMAGRVHVRGARVSAADLSDGDSFIVGQTSVAVSPNLLAGRIGEAISSGRGLPVDLRNVSFQRDGTVLLDDLSLRIEPGEMVAVVGPSGAGKSTLIKVLLCEYRPTTGVVTVGGSQIGVGLFGRLVREQVRCVPQSESDDVYSGLTVYETLTFAARLRATVDTPCRETRQRVDAALDWLGLQPQRNLLVRDLSGGQRRRVSIGMELVGRPQLLVLDEPTSSLDPGKERDIMQRLHDLARTLHCTVIVVTHSVSHVDSCDRVVVLARGGRIRYVGAPAEAIGRSGHTGWADWMVALDAEAPRSVARAPEVPPVPTTAAPPGSLVAGTRPVMWRQVLLIARRGPASLLAFVALPLVGTVIAAFASDRGLQGPEATQPLALIVTIAALTGSALSYQDLVNERSVLKRDWRVGVTTGTLLWSKAAVYGVIAPILAVLMTVLYAVLRPLPRPAFGLPPGVAVALVLFSIVLGSIGLGLIISSASPSWERAVTWNTLLAVGQVALSGGLFRLPLVLHVLSPVVPSRLGLGALASYGDLNADRTVIGLYTDPLWRPDVIVYWLLLITNLVLFVVATSVAVWCTERSWSRGDSQRPTGP